MDNVDNSSGTLIRITRYKDAELVNLSIACKDVTFNATPASAHNKQKVNRWAHYKDNLEKTLIEAAQSFRTLDILVYRYQIKTIPEDEKPTYELRDVIVNACIN